MEVHHHPNVEKKNFKEYLLEFFMLFLAVFLGFIAENIREHNLEKEKGKQYIQSFCEDLKDDTIELTRIAADFKSKDEALNDISKCYDSVSGNLPYTVCIKQMFLSSQSFENFNNSDRTLQQLKNAGGLRLLSTADADSVAVYDHMVRDYELDETTVVQETQTTLRSIGDELFSYVVQNNNDFSGKKYFCNK